MDERPVLFLDSGLGSFPYGHSFHVRNAAEKLICVADRANFPYGGKSRDELIALLDTLVLKLISQHNPKVLALACNTASVTALAYLREKHPSLLIVGTVPAVKPAVITSVKRRVGVLGTVRTIDDPCIRELARQYGPDCEITGVAAPDLVEFAEHRYVNATVGERLGAVSLYIEKFRSLDVDAIVLGCTHFLLLIDEFRTAAGKDIGVYDSVEGISRRVESILDGEDAKLRANPRGEGGAPLVVITGGGKPEPYWEQLCTRFGFTMEKTT